MTAHGKTITASDPRYSEVLDFLYREAELLDSGRFSDWLGRMTEDLIYRMPVRINQSRTTKSEGPKTEIFSDNIISLRLRVNRLATDFAWAESPPSRTRHLVTNVRVRETEGAEELAVWSCILVYRDRPGAQGAIFSGERQDLLRKVNGQWRLARRTIVLDQAIVKSRNLSIFF